MSGDGERIIAHLEADAEARDNGTQPTEGRRLSLTPASDIRSGGVRWLSRDRIPLGGLTVIAGEKGLGKSIYSNAHLVAALTRGELEGELHGQPADVLIATAEDSWAAVI